MSEELFWSLVRSGGLSAEISEAEVVNGGLSPPPSQVYPGRKCYMVTVQVKGGGVGDGVGDGVGGGRDMEKRAGFGPSPGIARRAAILEACKAFRSAAINDTAQGGKDFADELSNSDSDMDDVMPNHRGNSNDETSSRHAKRLNGIAIAPLYSSNGYVLKMLHDLAERKGVEIKMEVIQADSEVGEV